MIDVQTEVQSILAAARNGDESVVQRANALRPNLSHDEAENLSRNISLALVAFKEAAAKKPQ